RTAQLKTDLTERIDIVLAGARTRLRKNERRLAEALFYLGEIGTHADAEVGSHQRRIEDAHGIELTIAHVQLQSGLVVCSAALPRKHSPLVNNVMLGRSSAVQLSCSLRF